MLDAACPGQVFTSPTPDKVSAAAAAADGGAGIMLIVKNYAGDVMKFEMAADMIDGPHETVLTNDDVAVEDSTYTTGDRQSVVRGKGVSVRGGHGGRRTITTKKNN